jgi:hypothetical protein
MAYESVPFQEAYVGQRLYFPGRGLFGVVTSIRGQGRRRTQVDLVLDDGREIGYTREGWYAEIRDDPDPGQLPEPDPPAEAPEEDDEPPSSSPFDTPSVDSEDGVEQVVESNGPDEVSGPPVPRPRKKKPGRPAKDYKGLWTDDKRG